MARVPDERRALLLERYGRPGQSWPSLIQQLERERREFPYYLLREKKRRENS